MPAGIARALERRQRTIAEAGQERARVVDADLLDLAGQGVLAFFDKGFRHRAHAVDRAVEPHRRVDAMRQQIPRHPRPGRFDVQPPQASAALWQIGIDGPILQELRPIMKNPPQPPLLDELPGQGHGGTAAIIVPNHVRHLGPGDGGRHLFGLKRVERQWLFAQDHLARLRGGQSDLRMGIVRRGDVDAVDVLAPDQLAPIRLDASVTPLRGEGFDLCFVAGADGLADDLMFEVEEMVDLGEGVRMGPAHEAVADESDAERFGGHGSRALRCWSLRADSITSLCERQQFVRGC